MPFSLQSSEILHFSFLVQGSFVPVNTIAEPQEYKQNHLITKAPPTQS